MELLELLMLNKLKLLEFFVFKSFKSFKSFPSLFVLLEYKIFELLTLLLENLSIFVSNKELMFTGFLSICLHALIIRLILHSII